MTPTQAQLCECDCLNYCGDDPHIRERKARPCRVAIDWAHEQALAIEAEREKERKLALFESQAKQIAELEAKVAAADKATRFAGLVLAEHRNYGHPSDVDGFFLQEAAINCGLLEGRVMEKPCGENCSCAEASLPEDWPLECLFTTEAGKAAIETGKDKS